jgi:hypothetical protein
MCAGCENHYFDGVVAGGEGGVVDGAEGCAAGGEDGVVVTSSPPIMANAAMATTTAATAAPISRFLLLFIKPSSRLADAIEMKRTLHPTTSTQQPRFGSR